MRIPAMRYEKVSVICALLALLASAGCHSASVSSKTGSETAQVNKVPAATASMTPVAQETPNQEELAEEFAKQGYGIQRGQYRNYEYGFTVLIPKGYVGIRDPNPQPQHGFWIVLSRQPKAEIDVYANYDAANYDSLDEAVDAQFRYLKKEGVEIGELSRQTLTLQKLPAMRVVARYKDKASGVVMIHDLIAAIRTQPYKDEYGEDDIKILYILLLRTPESRYSTDKELFERIVSSWKVRPLEG